MNRSIHFATTVAAVAVLAAGTTGCQMFFHSVDDADPATSSKLTADYDHKDLQLLAGDISNQLLANKNIQAKSQEIFVMMGINNKTQNHIDMQAITDTMMANLMTQSSMRFVNAADRDKLLKEQGYQLANATDATRTAIGKQLGASHMISGDLVEISHQSKNQVRVSRKEDVYYQMTVKVTNLETGMVEAMAQASAILGKISKGDDCNTCLLTEVSESRFRRMVVPGDVLELEVKLIKNRKDFFWFHGEAKVNGEMAAMAKFTAKLA